MHSSVSIGDKEDEINGGRESEEGEREKEEDEREGEDERGGRMMRVRDLWCG